ncbi:unnamed protein product [Dimorphilus gyrociliatus]|uniref:Uncharacterized protein n=1 Tax=Dimorphilus gyrociliatus TaxID=2664684 RepID=A0A7I8VDG3_9ANNE|nr:unnamed protein product [Dimorphilus gyrociliatus]
MTTADRRLRSQVRNLRAHFERMLDDLDRVEEELKEGEKMKKKRNNPKKGLTPRLKALASYCMSPHTSTFHHSTDNDSVLTFNSKTARSCRRKIEGNLRDEIRSDEAYNVTELSAITRASSSRKFQMRSDIRKRPNLGLASVRSRRRSSAVGNSSRNKENEYGRSKSFKPCASSTMLGEIYEEEGEEEEGEETVQEKTREKEIDNRRPTFLSASPLPANSSITLHQMAQRTVCGVDAIYRRKATSITGSRSKRGVFEKL